MLHHCHIFDLSHLSMTLISTDTHLYLPTHSYTCTPILISFSHTPDRLVSVLEQYRDKLHRAGENVHGEELDYIKEILASPVFNQYLLGNTPSHESSTLIAEATNDFIIGIQDTKSTPAEKQKSHLQRKESLKNLRNVVNPKISPPAVSKHPLLPESMQVTSILHPSVPKLSLTLSHNSKSRMETFVGPELKHPPEVSPLRQARKTTGDSNDSIVESVLRDVALDNSLSNSRMKNLSNSTSTLIDRTSSNGGPMLRKKSSESFLSPGSGGSLSGSQPNISTLRSSPQIAVKSNPFSGQELMGITIGSFPSNRPADLYPLASVSSSDGKPKLVLSPETRPPPPSYHDHMQKQLKHSQEATADEAQLSFQKTKSIDKLFDVSTVTSDEPHLHSPLQPPALTPPIHQPSYLTPPTHLKTNGLVTKDVSTEEKRRTTFTVRMDKGAEGLGFMVKAAKKEAKVDLGLSIQDLQPGGLAER